MEVTKKRIDQIKRKRRYGFRVNGRIFYAEPTPEDVAEAIRNREFETRGLQQHAQQLQQEWEQHVAVEDRQTAVRRYHARRMAFLWVNGWSEEDVIKVCVCDVLEDGAHRLLAAKYNNATTADCVTVMCNKCGRV
jgi:hypothetical protein